MCHVFQYTGRVFANTGCFNIPVGFSRTRVVCITVTVSVNVCVCLRACVSACACVCVCACSPDAGATFMSGRGRGGGGGGVRIKSYAQLYCLQCVCMHAYPHSPLFLPHSPSFSFLCPHSAVCMFPTGCSPPPSPPSPSPCLCTSDLSHSMSPPRFLSPSLSSLVLSSHPPLPPPPPLPSHTLSPRVLSMSVCLSLSNVCEKVVTDLKICGHNAVSITGSNSVRRAYCSD